MCFLSFFLKNRKNKEKKSCSQVKNFRVKELWFVVARGEIDKLEGPKYAARRAELRRKAKEAARTRDRQAAAASQNLELWFASFGVPLSPHDLRLQLAELADQSTLYTVTHDSHGRKNCHASLQHWA